MDPDPFRQGVIHVKNATAPGHTNSFKTTSGMTLVEVILSMALLALVAMFITPVFLGSFKVILSGGNRNQTGYLASGDVEDYLAVEDQLPPDATEGAHTILLPSDVEVKTDMTTMEHTLDEGTVDMSIYQKRFDLSDPDNTKVYYEPVYMLKVDTAGWSLSNPSILLSRVSIKMEYVLYEENGTPGEYIHFSQAGTVPIEIVDPTKTYILFVRQTDWHLNAGMYTIRARPDVYLEATKNAYFRWNGTNLKVEESDRLEYRINNGDWTRITANTKVTRKASQVVVVRHSPRYSPSLPPSLPTVDLDTT